MKPPRVRDVTRTTTTESNVNEIINSKACLRYVHLQWSGSCYQLVQNHSPFYGCLADSDCTRYRNETDSAKHRISYET